MDTARLQSGKTHRIFFKNISQTFHKPKSHQVPILFKDFDCTNVLFPIISIYISYIGHTSHTLPPCGFFSAPWIPYNSLKLQNKPTGWRTVDTHSSQHLPAQVVLPAVCQNGNAFGYAARLLRNDPNIAFQVRR